MKKGLILSSLILLVAASVFGQTAQVTGMITDPAGMVVPGAEVVVLNVDCGSRKLRGDVV